ncbi:MAG TPA: YihY/virulence factor BrkB family protein [Acidimicrobiales bacterium]|nr:YihY/virulence factor BrkB family protein [Acidimicrobiales bacterium]
MIDRILGPLARRWAWADTLLRVQKRFEEVHGNYLAAAVTLTAFLSLFPLMLFITGVVGFFSRNSSDLPAEIISRLGIPPGGDAADMLTRAVVKAEQSRRAASVVGVLGLLWSGLGVVASFQFAFDSVWQVSGRGLKDKAFGLAWLGGAGLIFLLSFAVTSALRILPGPAWPVALVVSLSVSAALWLWTFQALTNRAVGWKALVPGAVLGAIGLELLKMVGALYVPRVVASSSALYGSIGVVFAVLAWLLVFGRLVVYSTVLNVVRWEEDHGTDTVEIELPHMPGEVPVTANRAGEAQPVQT